MNVTVGTRGSKLAMWQARRVQTLLEKINIRAGICRINSLGDQYQVATVADLGGSGVFTHALDRALLNKEIDIAVHSFKDLPTRLTEGLVVACVLERGPAHDVLVHRFEGGEILADTPITMATGSPRRKAFWLNRFPKHNIVGIRGNVDTRLSKLMESEWYGMILAKAGLERLGYTQLITTRLDWMIPAPAQGAIAVVSRKEDHNLITQLTRINHAETECCTRVERDFLARIEGDCLAPIAANASVIGKQVDLKAAVLDYDGCHKISIEMNAPLNKSLSLGKRAASEANRRGAQHLIN